MVAPVSGPFTVISGGTTGPYWKDQRIYRQKRPIDRPLSYHMDCAKILSIFQGKPSLGLSRNAWDYKVSTAFTSREMNNGVSLCFEKLKGEIGDRASMGENFLDMHQSVRTIESRARQLHALVSDVRKLRLGEALRVLTDPKYSSSAMKMSHPVKNVANQWLEFHLGIEPVVKDVYAAMQVMQKPLKDRLVKAKAYGGRYDTKTVINEGYRITTYDRKLNCYVGMQTGVAVSNPWLYLANSLGVINPVQVAWQATPLSFVADWFVNVEQFLGTPTDFLGLSLKNAETTLYFTGTQLSTMFGTNYNSIVNTELGGLSRTLGITLPSLQFRPVKVPGVARAATAVALLVGGLRSLDRQINYRRPAVKHFKGGYVWHNGYTHDWV